VYYAAVNLKQNLHSMYCTVEADDRHEASRGLFATAELLVHNFNASARLFSTSQFVCPFIHPFVWYQTVEQDNVKTNNRIMMPVGTGGL